MRFQTYSAIMLAAALAGCSGSSDNGVQRSVVSEAKIEAAETEAISASNSLESALREVLVGAMRSEGPVAAIGVCNEDAPEIAERVGQETGATVGRTALRVRNPSNAPDAWEREQLILFETLLAEGLKAEEISAWTLTNREEEAEAYRFMRPIMMGDVCSTCHGAPLQPAVKDAIDALYPDDAATGFEPGELRGAFTVTMPLD